MTPSTEAMELLLQRLAPRCASGASGVAGVRQVTGGASQSLWAFDAITPQGDVPLIVRSARLWSAEAQAGSAGMAAEATLLRAAAADGVPVPRVRTELQPGDGLGEGYVMDRLEGETQGYKILRDARFAAIRPMLASQCGAILARIHALPDSALPPLRIGWAMDETQEWTRRHRANGSARPVFEWALSWLQDHAPAAAEKAVLVHGDFRNGNLMVGADGVRAVLDWELSHRGDPMEDLGWFCMNAWRYGNIDQPAGGLGSRETLFAAYEAASDRRVDAARVHWWEVFGTLKWGVCCDSMGRAFRDGSATSLESVAVGRRASETEIDLLQLLAPRS